MGKRKHSGRARCRKAEGGGFKDTAIDALLSGANKLLGGIQDRRAKGDKSGINLKDVLRGAVSAGGSALDGSNIGSKLADKVNSMIQRRGGPSSRRKKHVKRRR